jgi:hypothetical protein
VTTQQKFRSSAPLSSCIDGSLENVGPCSATGTDMYRLERKRKVKKRRSGKIIREKKNGVTDMKQLDSRIAT